MKKAHKSRKLRKNRNQLSQQLNLTFKPKLLNAIDELVERGCYAGPVEYFAAKVRHDMGWDEPLKVRVKVKLTRDVHGRTGSSHQTPRLSRVTSTNR